MSTLFDTHWPLLDKALDVCVYRYSWTAFPESPSSKIHGREIPKAAIARVRRSARSSISTSTCRELIGSVGEEVSPFTEEPLGVSVSGRGSGAACSRPPLVAREDWSARPMQERVGIMPRDTCTASASLRRFSSTRTRRCTRPGKVSSWRSPAAVQIRWTAVWRRLPMHTRR